MEINLLNYTFYLGLGCSNVIVDNRETCKVADFGLLREFTKDDTIYQATTDLPCNTMDGS